MAGFNIKHWFADGAFRTIIRNSAWLGSSNVVSALLGLLALSCAGKGMTPAMFGVLVIVQSYAKSISDFIKFQTWQLVVQYGTPALTNNNLQQFRNVVSFSFSLDIVSGAVAIVGGIALLPFLSHSLGLDDQSFLAGSAVLHAHSFNGFLHADRHSACGRSLRFNCCTAGDETFSARSGERRSLVF